jgi:hypothetical protein
VHEFCGCVWVFVSPILCVCLHSKCSARSRYVGTSLGAREPLCGGRALQPLLRGAQRLFLCMLARHRRVPPAAGAPPPGKADTPNSEKPNAAKAVLVSSNTCALMYVPENLMQASVPENLLYLAHAHPHRRAQLGTGVPCCRTPRLLSCLLLLTTAAGGDSTCNRCSANCFAPR